ncbi:hypothetical protein A7981_00975 [Methylovorus sp. MM2]|nr:hypothetical protein A7981_00975 [Methylovorus sp. MM2]
MNRPESHWNSKKRSRLWSIEHDYGMPYESLTNMSLQRLLGIAHSLGSLQLHMDGQVSEYSNLRKIAIFFIKLYFINRKFIKI